ncbi:MAG: pilus assembly protein PilV [Candidatus Accumulibacter sp.]|jgi:type IV pilus assembly protein PilV|nr:pilus assembly protein PilV [Accumulibacter sp.]
MNGRRLSGDVGAGQSGIMLLETLIAILIFSLGILAVIGIQATSIRMAADAQLRSKASLLADRLVGEMWASGGKITDLATKFQSPGGTSYVKWRDEGVMGAGGLPGVDPEGDTAPTVAITSGGVVDGEARNAQVTITLFWRTHAMSADESPHRHTVISFISRNP